MFGPGHGMMGPGMAGSRYGRPMHRPHPMMHRPRHYSYLGTGLSAMVGAAIGTKIVNNVANKQNNTQTNYSSNNYYEVFSYCPNCGTKRGGNNTNCFNCGASLVK